MMSYPLAVFTYQLGSFSETFIKRHMEDLLPGRTALVTEITRDAYGGHWKVEAPTLVVEEVEKPRLRYQLLQAACKKMGWEYEVSLDEAAVKKFCRDHGVKVILAEYLTHSLRWIRLARELGIRLFAHAHGYDVSAVLRDLEWRRKYLLLNEADGIITMSNVSSGRLIELGLEESKIHVIPYGVDVPMHFQPRRDGQLVRCLVVSRMTGKKGPILLLDAFRRALKVCPNLRLDWIGEGNLMPAAIQFVQAFNLSNYITFHGGKLNDFATKLMAKSDIYIQHSVTDPVTGDEEGLPVAILEAMANGLPVVSTRHAGIPEAVTDGLSGYLVGEGETVRMADRIVELANNFTLRQKMGEAGWRNAYRNFSWSTERNHLLTLMGLFAESTQA